MTSFQFDNSIFILADRSLRNRHWLERRASDGSFFESSRLCRQTAGGQIGQKFPIPKNQTVAIIIQDWESKVILQILQMTSNFDGIEHY